MGRYYTNKDATHRKHILSLILVFNNNLDSKSIHTTGEQTVNDDFREYCLS